MIHFRQITTLLIVLKLWFCLIPRRTRAMVPFPACLPYLQKVTKVADLISDFVFLSVTKSVKSQIKNPFLDSAKGTHPKIHPIFLVVYSPKFRLETLILNLLPSTFTHVLMTPGKWLISRSQGDIAVWRLAKATGVQSLYPSLASSHRVTSCC